MAAAAAMPGGTAARDAVQAWGRLETHDILVEPPPGFITAAKCRAQPRAWVVPQGDYPSVNAMLDRAQLRAPNADALRAVTRCEHDGCTLSPPLSFAGDLDPGERTRLYAELGRYRQNIDQFSPFRRSQEVGPTWFRRPEISPAGQAQIARVAYTAQGSYAVTDIDYLCSTLAPTDRVPFLRALVRTPALEVMLHVGPESDLAALANYWGVGRRTKDLAALLGSVADEPGGGLIDVIHLLPRRVRERVNTFPEPGEPARNCHWTALNFLTDMSDPRPYDSDEMMLLRLTAEFHPIRESTPHLGDVIVFRAADGEVLHTAVHVAADIAFTKNGVASHKPFVLSRKSELMTEYGAAKMELWRRNDL